MSGAGYPCLPIYDILGIVVPFIVDEEPKIRQEPLKLLGSLTENGIEHARIPITATATRVPVINGHLLSVNVKLKERPSDIHQVIDVMKSWKKIGRAHV